MPESMPPLLPRQSQLISWIEASWHRTGNFPNKGHLNKSKLYEDGDLDHPTLRFALAQRGIDVPLTRDDEIPKELTKEQLSAILTITDYTDKRSHMSKLKSLGLTSQQWHGWLANPTFKNYLHDVSSRGFKDATHLAEEGLIKGLERGDTNAVKLYMEMSGQYTQDTGTNLNIKIVVARIVESIQRHVQDPQTIQLIANDFEVIMGGGVPDTTPRIAPLKLV